jgi:hypothetical protein
VQQDRRAECCAAAFQDPHGEPAMPGLSSSRNAAHDVSARLRQTEQHGEHGLPSAASCRRRNSGYLIAPGHASTAPQAWERSACSVAHSVSFGERVVTMMMLEIDA